MLKFLFPGGLAESVMPASAANNDMGGRSQSAAARSHLNVVVEGCCHGELDKIYASVLRLEKEQGIIVDLLLCCGDFQCLRSEADYDGLNVPAKFK